MRRLGRLIADMIFFAAAAVVVAAAFHVALAGDHSLNIDWTWDN